MNINKANLLELSAILDTADEEHVAKGEPTYYQGNTAHDCNTPACALGHWMYQKHKDLYYTFRWKWKDIMRDDFGLNPNQADEIFESYGCGRAETAKEAAAYIRQFVARHA